MKKPKKCFADMTLCEQREALAAMEADLDALEKANDARRGKRPDLIAEMAPQDRALLQKLVEATDL